MEPMELDRPPNGVLVHVDFPAPSAGVREATLCLPLRATFADLQRVVADMVNVENEEVEIIDMEDYEHVHPRLDIPNQAHVMVRYPGFRMRVYVSVPQRMVENHPNTSAEHAM